MKRHLPLLVVMLLVCLSFGQHSVLYAADGNPAFDEGLSYLLSKDFTEKEQGIQRIGHSGDPRAEEALRLILSGQLFYVKKNNQLVTAVPADTGYSITSFPDGGDLGTIKKRKLKKVTINNKLRGVLKNLLAQINLTHPDRDKRLEAARAILSDVTPELLPVLEKYYDAESDEEVRAVLGTTLTMAKLTQDDPEGRFEAVKSLRGNLNPEVKNSILQLISSEQDPKVRKEAEATLASIETTIAWYAKLETLFFGLSMGSVLVLAAIGLAITFGVIGVINMAHGELIMIGAYTTYVIQQLLPNSIGLALALAVPAAFCVSGLVGILIEKSVIRFLYGRPLETLLATFGISLVLQQAVRSIFSPLNRSVATPEWMSGSIVINPVLSLTTNRVTIFFFALLVFAGLYLLLKKSSLGLHVRAVAQNRSMARAMGVRAARVDALTFGLGSGIAGIAGVALSQLTNVGPNLGQAYIIDSFMVVVFGGVGNLWGTLLSGLTLGIANKFMEPWSGAVLAKILILIFIILFIQKRPQGLFPQKGRAAE